MEGWIKIHRKILDWEWWCDSKTLKLFLYLLLKANHETKKWKGITVKRGEIITGRKILAKECNLSEQSVRTSLNRLKSTNEITIKTTNKFSLIKVNNYNDYQHINQQANQQTTNKQPTNNHNEELKNIRIKENIYTEKFQKLNYNDKGLMYKRINDYTHKFAEVPSNKQIDHWIDTELNN